MGLPLPGVGRDSWRLTSALAACALLGEGESGNIPGFRRRWRVRKTNVASSRLGLLCQRLWFLVPSWQPSVPKVPVAR